MTTHRHLLATLVAAALLAAGCGSDESETISEAKASLSKDCQEGKASDKPLCDCIADELEKAGKTAKQIGDLADQVNDGKKPADITKAASACAAKAAG